LAELAQQFSREPGSMVVLLKTAVKMLRERLTFHALPTLLPFPVLALFLKYRNSAHERDRSLVVLLLVTAAALRLRRGMEYTEWSSVLIELPIYAYAARAVLGSRIQEWYPTGKVILTALALLFVWQYAENGYGPLTRRGSRVPVDTPRGTVRLIADQANHYTRLQRAVDALDPSGRRPVIAFGYSGSFNYFLDRPAPSPLTHGFRLSPISDPNEAVQRVRAAVPAPIAIDNPFFDFRAPVAGFQLLNWRPRMRINHYMRYDRHYFEAMVTGCTAQASGLRGFTLYDCPVRDGPLLTRGR
jgi:hypothetical protein